MEKHEIERVLGLQRRAYELLMWINQHAAHEPALLSEESVAALRYADSCRAWIEHRNGSFPLHLRTEPGDMGAFAHLLSAFLSTSFRVEEANRSVRGADLYSWEVEKRRRLVSGAAPARSKAAREKVEQSARNLQFIALEELAIENDCDLSRAQLEALLRREDLSASLALWSYGHELVRRSKFASQGAAVHSLWRALDDNARQPQGRGLLECTPSTCGRAALRHLSRCVNRNAASTWGSTCGVCVGGFSGGARGRLRRRRPVAGR